MPKLVLEAIIDRFEAAVRGITVGAGYSVTMRDVKAFEQSPLNLARPAAAIYSFEEEPVDPEHGTIGFEERLAPIVVEGLITESERDNLDRELIRLQHDIYRACLADPQWDGLALDTIYQGVSRGIIAETDVGSAQVQFLVHYRFPVSAPWVTE